MVQFLLTIFGLSALFMAMGKNPKARKWAPIVGLCGQPFWMIFAINTHAYGVIALSVAYVAVYLHGTWVQWSK